MGLSDIFFLGKAVLKTTVDAARNTILAQLGSATEQYVDGNEAEWYQHCGFASRPSLPVAGVNAAECVAIRTGERDIVISSRDVRSMQVYGNLAEGETCLYAPGSDGNGQATVFLKQDGSITLHTTHNNTSTGTSVDLVLSPTQLAFQAPWGNFRFDASGFHLITASGAAIDLGGVTIPGVPSAVANAISSSAVVTAGVVTCKGNIVNLGPGPTYGNAMQAPAAAYVVPVPLMSLTTGPATMSGTVRVSAP